jgi:hypothetical protein
VGALSRVRRSSCKKAFCMKSNMQQTAFTLFASLSIYLSIYLSFALSFSLSLPLSHSFSSFLSLTVSLFLSSSHTLFSLFSPCLLSFFFFSSPLSISTLVTFIYFFTFNSASSVRLCHPPDGSTNPKYKLLCFKPP